MKTLRILLSCICIFLSSTIYAYDIEVDGLYYTFNESPLHSLTFSYDEQSNYNYSGDIVIPENVTYYGIKYTVTSVDCRGFFFSHPDSVTSISIPSTVQYINDAYYLSHLNSLSEIEVAGDNPNYMVVDGMLIHKTVQTIISGNTRIEKEVNIVDFCLHSKNSIIVPDNVAVINYTAFANNKKLERVVLPNKSISIGQFAFSGCSNLSSINLPEGLLYLDSGTFNGCEGLRYIELPSTLKRYGGLLGNIDYNPAKAFGNCSNLETVFVNSNNNDFVSENGILYSKDKTELLLFPGAKTGNVVVPATVTSIDGAFDNCYNLQSLTLQNGYVNVFIENCPKLQSITLTEGTIDLKLTKCPSLSNLIIPSTVTTLDLSGASSLTTLTIPSNVVSMNLTGCANLKEISVSEGVEEFSLSDNKNIVSLVLPSTLRKLSLPGCSNISSLVLPSHLETLDIRKLNLLTSLVLPDGIKEINLWGCTSINTLNYPQSLESINLTDCKELSVVNVPNGAKFLSLQGCEKITDVTIPASLTEFWSSNTGLTTITYADGVETLFPVSGANIKSAKWTNSVKTIPNGTFQACTLLESIGDLSSVKSVGEHAFENCWKLNDVSFGSSLASVGEYAFYECKSLRKIELSGTIKELPNYVFSGCVNLEDVKLPTNVKIFAEDAFSRCSKLKTLILPEKLESIGESAFYESGLTSIVLPESVVELGDYAFGNCYDLENIELSSSLETIPEMCFAKCQSLKTLIVPENVELIKHSAVWYCTSLETIELPAMLKNLEGNAISFNDNLKSVICHAVEPPTIVSLTTFYQNPKMIIYVNPYCVDIYKNNSQWGNFTIKAIGEEGNNEPSDDPTPSDPSDPSDVEVSTDLSAYPNVLYFNDVENKVGDFNLALNMKCAEENITAFQCDVYLPEGVTWKSTTDKRGNIVYDQPTFNEDRTDESYHSISPIALNADGSYRMIVYSMSNEIILETDGAILTLPLSISEEMEAGEYNLIIKGIVVTDVNKQQTLVDKVVSRLTIPSYTLGDVNGDDMINVTDVVSVIAYILGDHSSDFIFPAGDINEDGVINVTDVVSIIDIILNSHAGSAAAAKLMAVRKTLASGDTSNLEIIPFAIAEGTSSSTVKLNLNNPGDEFTAFQCDIQLPEGIDWENTVDKRGNVKYTTPVFDSEADRTDASYHTVSVQKTDGIFRVIVYSMANETILDEEGAVLDIPFVYADDIASGVYDVSIKNVVLTRVNKTDVKPADYTFSVLVGSPAESAIALNGNFTDEAINDYNTALATNTTVAAIDLSDVVGVSSNTAFTTGNKNLVLYVAEGVNVKNTNNVVAGDECASLILTDGYSFAAPKAFTANNASYSRTMDTTWGTICLPYAVASDESTAYYEITGVENDVIILTKYDELPAGTPALVKKLSGTEIAPQATSVAVSGDINDVTGTIKMYGSYTNKVRVEDPNSYYIYNNKFYSCNEYFFCNAFRAFFTLESAGAKMLRIADDDDVVTAIDALTGEGNGIGVESIYGEDGILRKDMEKGMNIVKFSNGKTQKIIIK